MGDTTYPVDFYPRPPRGGRPTSHAHSTSKAGISIHALREEGDNTFPSIIRQISISIHALREEGDRSNEAAHIPDQSISIHALREEGDSFCTMVLIQV